MPVFQEISCCLIFCEMRVIPAQRKSRVLSKVRFGCLSEAYSINVTKGCQFRCVYCYARAYPEAPHAEKVYVYTNLAHKLSEELDNPRRRIQVDWVVFNTASDSFQADPQILDITFKSMKVLLERGIGISFLTKGWIPDRFVGLFRDYPEFISAGIGLVSLSKRYKEIFEPGAADPWERLLNMERLSKAGIEVHVRVDPIIPFLTDTEHETRSLLGQLKKVGVEKVTLSYLHLRPAIAHQLKRELPSTEFKLLGSFFETQPWSRVGTSTKSKLVPRGIREKGYERFKAISQELGMVCLVCSCKNPDLRGDICTGRGIKRKGLAGREQQLSLFKC